MGWAGKGRGRWSIQILLGARYMKELELVNPTVRVGTGF